jgi:hypothetical protein
VDGSVCIGGRGEGSVHRSLSAPPADLQAAVTPHRWSP